MLDPDCNYRVVSDIDNEGTYVYDDRNNILSYTSKDKKFSYEARYNENNNMIFYKDSNEYSCKKQYDERGNLIYYSNSNRYTCVMKYNIDDKLIKYVNNEGISIGRFRLFIRRLLGMQNKLEY